MEFTPRYENLANNLKEKISFAASHAIDIKEYQKIQDKLEDAAPDSPLEKATITVKTIAELGLVLEFLGMSDELVDDTVAHENAHANKAEILGARTEGYKVVLLKQGDRYIIQPRARIYIPDEWTEEEQRRALKEIIEAPVEYENTLSPGDISDLNSLHR